MTPPLSACGRLWQVAPGRVMRTQDVPMGARPSNRVVMQCVEKGLSETGRRNTWACDR
jgi:hypothetical protein